MLAAQQITVTVDPSARQWLADRVRCPLPSISLPLPSDLPQSFDPAYGARPVKRTIQRAILNPLSRLLLEGKVCFSFPHPLPLFLHSYPQVMEKDEVKVTLAPSGEGLQLVPSRPAGETGEGRTARVPHKFRLEDDLESEEEAAEEEAQQQQQQQPGAR
jgi:hypothetical protein